MSELIVLVNRQPAGVLSQSNGRLTLEYNERWRLDAGSTPISMSLPLARTTHEDPQVRAFLWGLLPDNEQVIARWARTYHVSASNVFSLLSHVGEDCAGAIQFASPRRAEQLLAGEGGVEWIDEQAISARLRTLRRDPTAWHMAATTGQFSLAGAQAKTALHFDPENERWGDPWGTVPTTHILKPAIAGFDDHDLNEHLCLEAARHLGLRVATSRVTSFAGERAIVVSRYDRIRRGRETRRVHQEDMCQALGLLPASKYQNEGGPSPERIIELLRSAIREREYAADAVSRFVDALVFNWVIAGTDAHAKNYSILLAGPQVRFAPLYDIASTLPYEDMYLPRLRMSMRIGGEYRLEGLAGRHWRRFAESNGLDQEVLMGRIDELTAQAPEAFAHAADRPAVKELTSDLPRRLADLIAKRAEQCRRVLVK